VGAPKSRKKTFRLLGIQPTNFHDERELGHRLHGEKNSEPGKPPLLSASTSSEDLWWLTRSAHPELSSPQVSVAYFPVQKKQVTRRKIPEDHNTVLSK